MPFGGAFSPLSGSASTSVMSPLVFMYWEVFSDFIYRHAPKHAARIVTLYQHLLKAQWIAPDTNPDDFSAIFEGNPSTARIKWIGKQAYLYYLIRQLVDLQLVSIPQNASIWQIVESHFLDKNSRPFHNFNKQKEPIKAKAAIDKLIEILQPSA